MTSYAPSISLIHARVPGRRRYAVSALRRDDELCARAAQRLRAVDGVTDVRASPLTSTVLVQFASEEACEQIEAALCELFSAVIVHPPVPAAPASGPNLFAGIKAKLQSRAAEPRAPRQTSTQGASGASAQVDAAPAAPPPDSDEAYHALTIEEVFAKIEGRAEGLTGADAAARLAADGPNALRPAPRRSQLRILLDQFASTPVAMLGASALLSAFTGGIGDAVAILAVLGINAGIGYGTESGAERTITSLTAAPNLEVMVLRDGKELRVLTSEIVRGDVVLLSPGVIVPADGRVISAQDLTIDESALTGESMPVGKAALDGFEPHVPLAERVNMVYRGTLVTGGSGRVVIVATADRTEVGRIQSLASGVEQRDTPMQQQLDKLGSQLAVGAGVACAATMGVGILRGQAPLPMLRTAISLGVAAVPEGLPTVAISTLALGLSRMRDEKVLVRQLAAVETLGSVQVVCLDKTGTLTENRMSVVALNAGRSAFAVQDGRLKDSKGAAVEGLGADVATMLHVSVLCSEVELDEVRGACVLKGSPTESALVQLAMDLGIDVREVRNRHPLRSMQRRAERRNYMSTLHDTLSGRFLAVKGRPSEVLAMCAAQLLDGEIVPLSDDERERIETENECLAGRALRMLGIAYLDREGEITHDGDSLPELVWIGLIGMEDPPRPGVADVIASFHTAGIRTVMITGDQSATAQAIGKAVGLSENGSVEIVDSTRLDKLDPEVLSALAQRTHVFSRVSPAHKLQIVQALQRAGYVVAMTGDGINDGPALKAADIGIAMGAGGTTVAREVADVVLSDDKLQTLVLAIQQGRTIYEDIRKAVHFILSTNLSEILYTFASVVAGLGEPLTPMQLLWINLLTDVFPELALAVQPPESDVLARPPRDPHRPMFVREDLLRIGLEGTVITTSVLGAYVWARRALGPGPQASTVGFTALTLAQLLHAISARSEHHSIFDREHLARNPWLVAAISGTILLQLGASFIPGLRSLLGTVPMTPRAWGVSLAAAGTPFLVNEALKLTARRERGTPASPMPSAVPEGVASAV
jgi:Ca2+-transporting ATPase